MITVISHGPPTRAEIHSAMSQGVAGTGVRLLQGEAFMQQETQLLAAQ